MIHALRNSFGIPSSIRRLRLLSSSSLNKSSITSGSTRRNPIQLQSKTPIASCQVTATIRTSRIFPGISPVLAFSCWSLLASSSSSFISTAWVTRTVSQRTDFHHQRHRSIGRLQQHYFHTSRRVSTTPSFLDETMAKKKSQITVAKAITDKQNDEGAANATVGTVDDETMKEASSDCKGGEGEDIQKNNMSPPAENKRKRASPSSKTTTAASRPIATRSRKEAVVSAPPPVDDADNANGDDDNDDDDDDAKLPANTVLQDTSAAAKPKATRKRTTAASSSTSGSLKKKKEAVKEDDANDVAAEPEGAELKPKATKKRGTAAVAQNITTRDEIPKLWNGQEARSANGSYTFKVASWNVAGLRALLRNDPNALVNLLKRHDLDVLCLQETKLQESHVQDPQFVEFREEMMAHGYHIYFSCSVERKGYSGTAVLVRRGNNPVAPMTNGGDQPDDKKKAKKQTNLKSFFGAKKNESAEDSTPNAATTDHETASQPDWPEHVNHLFDSAKVSYGIGQAEHDKEGRVIVMDFPLFSLCNVYTPNSGQDLKRLSYRVEQWDKDFLSFIQSHSKERQLPILWLGDLNIAHRALDVYNDGAKHLAKQAGVTPQERASFTQQLADSEFVDVFRHLHPTAQGHYTYWSTRAGNRDANKGLRLDYFVCDPVMLDDKKSDVIVRDSYMLPEVKGSDHCPIVLEMEIKVTDQK